MSKNSSYSEGSRIIFFAAILVFSCLLMVMLVVSQIDHFLFDGGLVMYLRSGNPKLFLGTILLLTIGIGPILVWLGMRYNKNVSDAYLNRIMQVQDMEQQEMEAQSHIAKMSDSTENRDVTRQHVEALILTDAAFRGLYQRFRYYLTQVSGEFSNRRNQAVDVISAEQPNWFFAVYFPAAAILLLIGEFIFIYYYFENRYQITPAVAIQFAAREHPSRMIIVSGLMSILIISGILVFVKNLGFNVLGSVSRLMKKTLNEHKAPAMDKQYARFLHSQWRQIQISPYRTFKILTLILSMVPGSLGFAIGERNLLVTGLIFGFLSLLFSLAGIKRLPTFEFHPAGWIRLIEGKQSKEISLKDCARIHVNYDSILGKSVSASSMSALGRGVAGKTLMGQMGLPQLVPDGIFLHVQDGNTYQLPLRRLQNQVGEKVDSHEVEFFFALWLKEHGFEFELSQTYEDAGDWQATQTA